MSNKIDFRTDKQKEADRIKEVRERELETLNFSFIAIARYTQVIGSEVYEYVSSEDKPLFMIPNMSIIHRYKYMPDGKVKRTYSQVVAPGCRIYYI